MQTFWTFENKLSYYIESFYINSDENTINEKILDLFPDSSCYKI